VLKLLRLQPWAVLEELRAAGQVGAGGWEGGREGGREGCIGGGGGWV
jgi:hypothetical protein